MDKVYNIIMHALVLYVHVSDINHNYVGTARRLCVDGVWGEVQVLECGSSGFNNAATEVLSSHKQLMS